MMRRKPYAQLPGVSLSVDPVRLYGSAAVSRAEPAKAEAAGSAPPATLDEADALRFSGEIRNLAAIVERYRLGTDAESGKACDFVAEKLADASRSLDRGDAEKSWLHLYSAAKLCVNFGIETAAVNGALARINRLI